MTTQTTKVYLCGPINGCTDEECKDWRQYCKDNLPANFQAADPMDRDYRGREHMEGIAAEIVENDKADIDGSEILIVNYVKPSVGTSMEILYAHDRNKRIILVCAESERPKLSPWLIYHVTDIVHTFERAIMEL